MGGKILPIWLISMKRAEEYVNDFWGEPPIRAIVSHWDICYIIKRVQEDTIKETVQACANNAVVEVVDQEEWLIDHLPANDNRGYTILPVYGVDDQSILKVADKLIKELE